MFTVQGAVGGRTVVIRAAARPTGRLLGAAGSPTALQPADLRTVQRSRHCLQLLRARAAGGGSSSVGSQTERSEPPAPGPPAAAPDTPRPAEAPRGSGPVDIRLRYVHISTSSMWDEEMVEETAERELQHLQRTCQLPGLGCGGAAPAAGEQAEGHGEDQGQQAQGASHGGSAGGGGNTSLAWLQVEEGPGAEGTQWGEERRRVRRVRLLPSSRRRGGMPGAPARPSAASTGEDAPPPRPPPAKQQQARRQPRKAGPSKQLRAGGVSLPSPEAAPLAEEQPHTGEQDAGGNAAARWGQDSPPLMPPLGPPPPPPADGSGPPSITYADAQSQQLLQRYGPQQRRQLEEYLQQQRRRTKGGEVLRLFAVQEPGPLRREALAAAELDVVFRGSFPVLAAWLLAQVIVAPGRLVWTDTLRPLLPAPLRRPADVLFWALFAGAVLWPLI